MMKIKPGIWSGALLAVCVGGLATILGCKERQPAPPQPPGPEVPAQVKKGGDTSGLVEAPKLVSAEKNSFAEVTAKLDPGGSLFVYLSTEEWLSGLSGKVAEWQDLFASLPGGNRQQNQEARQVLGLIGRLIKASGMESVSGVGMSGIALEKGYYQTKTVVHHYPGQSEGLMWSVFGSQPHALRSQEMLPTNTVLAVFGDLHIDKLWTALQQEAQGLEIKELNDFFINLPLEFEKNTGLRWPEALASPAGEVGLVLTLDERKPVKLPLPNRQTLSMPTPGIVVAVKVNDDLIFNRLREEIGKHPDFGKLMVQVDEPDLKMAVVPFPLPLPVPVRVTLARTGDYLLLASNDDLVREMLSVKSGQTPNLKSTSEFGRLAQGLPTEGNSYSFVSQKFSETLRAVVTQAMMAQPPASAPPPTLIEKLSGLNQMAYGYSVGQVTAEGWYSVSHSTQSPAAALLAAPAFMAGMMAAIAIPNFVKARTTAQKSACVNNLRMIDGAKEQWALENKKTSTDTPTWGDLVGPNAFIRTQPQCPQGGTYTLGNMSTKPRCSVPAHALMR